MIKYFYLFLIAFCFVSCTDKCEDGAVQYDIAKIKNSITTDDDEINFVDVYCKNNALTYVYEINSNEEWAKKLTEPSAKKEFNEIAMGELRKFYCNQSVVDFYAYKEKGIGVKWQYFLKGDKKPFSEVFIGSQDCK